MFDPVLLRTFLVVAETRGFTRAAQRLGLRQSTVSQQVRKLEAAAGRTLFLRDTHSVELTGDGEAMTGFARTILDGNERAMAYFAGPELRGKLRFGASEDFVHGQLPDILRRFRRTHPLVDLELTVELSGVLHQRMRAGELDLALAKRQAADQAGRPVWRQQLVWTGAPDTAPATDAPLPLIVYPPPSITRARALDALRERGRAWRIACTSGSLSGLRAAVLAGLGVAVFARGLIPDGLVELAAHPDLPDPGEVEFMLTHRGSALTGPAAALAEAVVADVDRLHGGP
jgi:DNA-binding transcriptional LysR family regulator